MQTFEMSQGDNTPLPSTGRRLLQNNISSKSSIKPINIKAAGICPEKNDDNLNRGDSASMLNKDHYS